MYYAQLQEQQLNEQAKLIAALTAKIDNLAAHASTESTAAKPSDKAVKYVGCTNLPSGLLPLKQLLPDPQHPIGPPFLLGLRIGMLVGHAGLRTLKGGLLTPSVPRSILSAYLERSESIDPPAATM